MHTLKLAEFNTAMPPQVFLHLTHVEGKKIRLVPSHTNQRPALQTWLKQYRHFLLECKGSKIGLFRPGHLLNRQGGKTSIAELAESINSTVQ